MKYLTLLLTTTWVVISSVAIGESLDSLRVPTLAQQVEVSPEVPEVPEVQSVIVPEVIAENNTLEVGQLARLEAVGDQVDWTCVPSIEDGQALGNSYVCSFRKPGVYTVVAAIATYDGQVKVLTCTLTVKGPPKPPPKPTPKPTPSTLDSVTSDASLVDEVSKYARGTSRSKVSKVSKVFLSVADQIRSGELTQGSEIVITTAEMTQKINVSGTYMLMSRIQGLITKRDDAGLLETPSQYLELWLSIGEGLNAAP